MEAILEHLWLCFIVGEGYSCLFSLILNPHSHAAIHVHIHHVIIVIVMMLHQTMPALRSRPRLVDV